MYCGEIKERNMRNTIQSRTGQPRSGFTLVELLVVIGIIALLISILLPSLNRARGAAQSVQCLSNLRQVGQSMLMYTSDHQGRLPYGNTWSFGSNPRGDTFHAALSRYTCRNYDDNSIPWSAKNNFVIGPKGVMPKGIWTCPSLTDISDALAAAGNHAVFAGNAKLFGDKYDIWNTAVVFPQMNITRVRGSSGKIAFVEYNMNGQDVNTVNFAPGPSLGSPISTAYDVDATWNLYGGGLNDFLRYRHNKRSNALFVDGHAEGLVKGTVTRAPFQVNP